jgi:hypothetical protein
MRNILFLSASLCLCLGCGSGDYEAALANRKTSAPADTLSPAQDLPGTKVSIRVPASLGSPLVGAEDSRTKPGIITIPGLKLTYEVRLKDSEGGEQPYYCYVGAVEAAASPMQAVTNDIQGALATLPKRTNLGNWADFPVQAPDGRQIPWRKIHCTGEQTFLYKDAKGQAKPIPLPGTLDVYLHEEGGFVVVIAWRMPTSVEQALRLDDLARSTAGGVSVKP